MTLSRNTIVALVALLAAAGAYYKMVLSPQRDKAADLQTQVEKAESTLQQAKQALADNEKARGGYSAAYASVVRLGKAVPADDDIRSLMVQLDGAAKATQVDFRSIDVGAGASTPAAGAAGNTAAAAALPPGATVGPAGFPAVPLTFEFKGQFFRLSDFLAKLERFVTASNNRIAVSGRLLTVDSLTLEPHADGYPQMNAQVTATSYLVPATEGLTGGATAQSPGGTAAVAQPKGSGGAPTPTTATSTGAIR